MTFEPTWNDYKHLSSLFRFYLQVVIKAFTLVMGVSGATVAFVLGRDASDRGLAIYGLLLPALLCLGMGIAFWRCIASAEDLTKAMLDLQSGLRLRLAPHGANLEQALRWFGIVLMASGVLLTVFFLVLLVKGQAANLGAPRPVTLPCTAPARPA